MSGEAEVVLFWILAVPLVAFALGVVLARSPVHSAMSLVAAFFCLAGIYVLLTAQLIAFLQILVYAGAVMVLFLFVIMLLSLSDRELGVSRVKAMQILGALGALGITAVVLTVIRQLPGGMAAAPEGFGTVKAVGAKLFSEYLLPFEATSILLLVAIVGAVVVAKEKI